MGIFGSSRGDKDDVWNNDKNDVRSWRTKTYYDSDGNRHWYDHPQINQEVVEGPDTKTHRYYNPSTGSMGEVMLTRFDRQVTVRQRPLFG